MAQGFTDSGTDNQITCGSNVTLTGSVRGRNNRIVIGDSVHPTTLTLKIHGDRNEIVFDGLFAVKGLVVACGNHVPAHETRIRVGGNFSIEGDGRFFLYTSGGSLVVGDNCMFSNKVTIRCGESPHLIFDRNTGEFLDQPKGVTIGNHVWVGESVYITKSAAIPDECVVGACAVVTKKFNVTHAVIAGNPARITRENVQWVRNTSVLTDQRFRDSHRSYHAKFVQSVDD